MQSNTKWISRWSFTLAAVAFASAIPAHHSATGYDTSKTEVAQGTLKEFRWGAPHSTLVFAIASKDGKSRDISMGGGAPGKFVKQGFNPRDFKVGDKMEVSWHPARNGSPGGLLTHLKLKDGREYQDDEFKVLEGINANHFKDETP